MPKFQFPEGVDESRLIPDPNNRTGHWIDPVTDDVYAVDPEWYPGKPEGTSRQRAEQEIAAITGTSTKQLEQELEAAKAEIAQLKAVTPSQPATSTPPAASKPAAPATSTPPAASK